jgi:CPA2 family monovalent cation:H+ antiporter-2
MDAHAGLPHLQPILLFLAIAGLVMPLLARARVSQVVAFLIAGALFGPHGLGRLAADHAWLGWLTIADGEGVQVLAELGVVFMLFLIGLELPARQLWSLRRWVLGVGSAQWLGCGALIGVIAFAFGNGHEAALVLGLGLAMSSTAVVMQLLAESGQTRSTVGRMSFAVLLLQDIAVVPLLILLGLLGDPESGGNFLWLLVTALAKAALAVTLILLLGRLVLTPLFRHVSVTTQADTFMALTLFATLGVAALTGAAGLSMALGAFLAGLMLSETEYRHAARLAIEPFKGLLMGLFFLSVGMSLDLVKVAGDALWLLLAVPGLYLLKGAVMYGLFRRAGLSSGESAEAALLLGPVRRIRLHRDRHCADRRAAVGRRRQLHAAGGDAEHVHDATCRASGACAAQAPPRIGRRTSAAAGPARTRRSGHHRGLRAGGTAGGTAARKGRCALDRHRAECRSGCAPPCQGLPVVVGDSGQPVTAASPRRRTGPGSARHDG